MTEQMQTFEVPADILDELKRRRGFVHAYERLTPKETALVVVDMQNYFMADGEPACAPAARLIVPNVNALAAKVRSLGGLVVWIMTEAKDETPSDWANLYECYSPEAKTKRQANLGKNGSGFPLWSKLEVEKGDEVVIKTRYSAFVPGASNLDSVLKKHGIDTILVTGVATNVCCESTARDGMMMGYRTVMVSDANAAFTQENHAHALRNFLVTFGDVQSTAQTLQNLERSAKQARAAE